MKEVEIKILNVNPSKIKNILKEHGGRILMKEYEQKTALFIHPGKKNNGVIRLRKDGRGDKITFKSNPKIVSGHKTAEEHETRIESFETVEAGLKMLGLKEIGRTTTKREDWELDGAIISINKYKKIPYYIEIESTPKNIEKIASILGYSKKDYCAKNLIAIYGEKKVND
jgi:predicted adenylyl cyclase CyaB